MPSFPDRLVHAWNAFLNKDPTYKSYDPGMFSSYRPDKRRLTKGNERSIINAILTRIAIDASTISIQHVQLDENDRYTGYINSGLNYCLNTEANIDQTGRDLVQDALLTMMDEGVSVVAPIDTDDNDGEYPLSRPSSEESGGYNILSLRVGKVVQWHPTKVKIDIYNDRTGRHEEIWIPKRAVAIPTDPFYSVLNEPNSTLQRLIRKLNILDVVDEQSGSGKLDLIIQLPYVVKSEARRQQAELRVKDIEDQLAHNKFGIAYTDGTEKITQLNRSVDNNLMNQIEYLMRMLYSQLGITEEIMNGTADEKTMNNYFNRTVEPIVSALVDEMKRKFLSKDARSRKESIQAFRDPFKLVPTSELSELADKLTRNEITTSNEFRQLIGMRPSKDPHADELRNKNLSPAKGEERVDVDGNVIQKADPSAAEE